MLVLYPSPLYLRRHTHTLKNNRSLEHRKLRKEPSSYQELIYTLYTVLYKKGLDVTLYDLQIRVSIGYWFLMSLATEVLFRLHNLAEN